MFWNHRQHHNPIVDFAQGGQNQNIMQPTNTLKAMSSPMSNLNNYPVHIFPPKLNEVIESLHQDTGMPMEMIGTTLLAALALVAQPLFDVASPFGNNKPEPCSLYFLTLAKSGEGKSPLREIIMESFDAFTTEMSDEYQERLTEYDAAYNVWSLKHKVLSSNYQKSIGKADEESNEERLKAHIKCEPKKPRAFKMFYDDATPEGIVKGLQQYPYAGVFSDEAITFFSGPLKSNLGLLNKIWKNEPVYVDRKKDKEIKLNAYLTFLLMAQPEVFERYMEKHGKLSVSSGFLARFLFTNTISTIESRVVNLDQERSRMSRDFLLGYFNSRFNEIRDHFNDESLPKKTLQLSDEAKELYIKKINQYQSKAIKGQSWSHIPEFVSKAASQALRIAGILDQHQEAFIMVDTLENAFTLVDWHLEQASKYFYTLSEQYQLQQDVYTLFNWLKRELSIPSKYMDVWDGMTGQSMKIKLQPWNPISKSDVSMYCPNSLRKDGRLDAALNQLVKLRVVAVINYLPSKKEYVARTIIGGGGLMISNPVMNPTMVMDKYINSDPLLDGYDLQRLQWE